jgi:hypothetical protein
MPLVRVVVTELGEPHELERGLDPRRDFAPGNPAGHQAESNVLLDVHPRE